MPIDWTPLVTAIGKRQRFHLTTHVRPDPDGLGSVLALADVLEGMGKQVALSISSVWPPRYDFMDPGRRIARFDPEGPGLRDVDVAIVLDTGTWNQLGDFGPALQATTAEKFVIDHHVSQDDLGAIRLQDISAEATGRLVFELALALRQPLSPFAASSLFAALATDTGWFRHKNTSAATFALAQRLVQSGADAQALYDEIYEQNSAARLRLLGVALGRLQVLDAGAIALTEVRREDYPATGAKPQDTEDFISFVRSITGIHVALLFMEQPAGGIKVSFRSRSGADVAAMAERFGGGGHKLASGATLTCSLAEAKEQVLSAVRAALATQ